ncbi:MAG: histidine phosphatase family protein [Leptospira sp.]|nr:histidine phosphatase family protein [Leptospira sp.]
MGLIYLLRHGQADSLGTNYDQLTELGHLQAKRAGEYFRRMRIEFDYVASGTLKRQIQTLQGILNPIQEEGICTPEPAIHEELNEFEGAMWKQIAINIGEQDPEYGKLLKRYKELQEASDPKCRKLFMGLIQRILKEWVEGGHTDVFPFDTYHETVIDILKRIPQDAGSVLLTSSATPVAIMAGYSLGLPKEDYLPLMKVISNTSYNVFQWENGKFSPVTINSYPHIQDPDEFSLL